MQQLEFFDIPSPCIGVCQSGKTGYCLGCYRSRDERLYWHKLDASVKRRIIKACNRRKRKAELATQSLHPQQEMQQESLFLGSENECEVHKK
ncbi:DUF1289 domain-containing protein [Lacimicrobium sp. SS2-24]|uniref:DUF1289 domain-containing protein n=1 Tax=Lacimicrobium sp. SS2-24 TaxID=2005569 RepID=UPI000B4B380B|nr:DUF1289 domain-containing protein [Lacimicrobium sp. SS2-24]